MNESLRDFLLSSHHTLFKTEQEQQKLLKIAFAKGKTAFSFHPQFYSYANGRKKLLSFYSFRK
jgi:hypothetical protein